MSSLLRKGSHGAQLDADSAVYAVAVEFKNEIVQEDRVLAACSDTASAVEAFVYVHFYHGDHSGPLSSSGTISAASILSASSLWSFFHSSRGIENFASISLRNSGPLL